VSRFGGFGAVVALFAGTTLHAQGVSFTAGGIHTRYADSLAGSAASVGVRVRTSSSALSSSLEGSFARFTDGYWAGQVSGGAVAMGRAAGRLAIGVRADGSLNYLEGGLWSGIGAAGPVFALAGRDWLAAISVTGGGLRRVDDTASALGSLSLQLRRGVGSVSFDGSLSGTAAGRVRYADAAIGAEWDRRAVTLAASGGIRLGDLGNTPWGQARVAWRLSPIIGLEATVGTYPEDVTGFSDGFFVTAGVRVSPPGPGAPAPPTVVVGARRRGLVQVTFAVPGASNVAIAGEWNAWTNSPLQRVGRDRWRAELPLPPGAYRFTLVTDGERWFVPDGVPKLPDDFGGEVGLLVVP
jgi:hypothetical protein